MLCIGHINIGHIEDILIPRDSCQAYHLESLSFNYSLSKEQQNNMFAIIIGYRMGDESLLTKVRQLKERYATIPIIITSRNFIDELSFWCLRNRMWDYIILPAETDYIYHKIDILMKLKNSRMPHRQLQFPSIDMSINSLISNTRQHHCRTQRAIDYIHEHYECRITTTYLAALCNMGVWTFCYYFKEEFKKTPSEYIRFFRITKSKQLLIETQSSVQQISYSVGYDDPSYFSRIFRKEIGMTPKTYRDTYLSDTSRSMSGALD